MGRVGNQPPRDDHDNFDYDSARLLGRIADLKKKGLTTDQALLLLDINERRRANELSREDGDNRDEHVAGLCTALNAIANAIGDLAREWEQK